jgi:hypothetical protein
MITEVTATFEESSITVATAGFAFVTVSVNAVDVEDA